MRNTIFLYVLFISIFTASCEDVVDIELNYSNERLVIEGQLNWIKETKQTEQFIILSKTTPYFENQRIPANNAQVEIIDQKNNIYKFEELNETGTYFPLDTIPYNLGTRYTNIIIALSKPAVTRSKNMFDFSFRCEMFRVHARLFYFEVHFTDTLYPLLVLVP